VDIQLSGSVYPCHDVRGLDIPVDELVDLSRFQGLGYLQDHPQYRPRRERSSCLHVTLHVLSVHQFHRVEVVVALLAEVMDSGYMRVLESWPQPALHAETGGAPCRCPEDRRQ
jgi:hypothetical protein